MTGAQASDVAASLRTLDRDRPNGPFMREGIARLQSGLDLHDPPDRDALLRLMQRLYAAGRFDLALGRLFEGHIDALQIIARYGTRIAAVQARQAACAGSCFGVWNAPLAGEPLRLQQGRLYGGKAFASGAGLLTHALVTVHVGTPDRVQLLLVDLHAHPPAVDTSWWHTLGMRRSETHLVRWHGAPLGQDAHVGTGGDYEREPWFSAGALRFVAVQAGGIAAIFDHVRDNLAARGRAHDPYQTARLGTLYGLADMAAAVVRRTVEQSFDGTSTHLARVANARLAVADLAERAITIAQQAVGVQALFEAEPLCRTLADLMVYLRQPGPDAQRTRVGRAAADGHLVPGL